MRYQYLQSSFFYLEKDCFDINHMRKQYFALKIYLPLLPKDNSLGFSHPQ